MHHHRSETPNGEKDHIEFERPVESVFFVLKEAKHGEEDVK